MQIAVDVAEILVEGGIRKPSSGLPREWMIVHDEPTPSSPPPPPRIQEQPDVESSKVS